MLTRKQIDAIAARAEKATPGPWQFNEWGGVTMADGRPLARIDSNFRGDHEWVDIDDSNAAFIAAARQDVPALCATIAELRELLYRIDGGLDSVNVSLYDNDIKAALQ